MSTDKNLPMAVIGDYEMVLPFQAVGIVPFVLNAQNRAGFPSLLAKLTAERYAVVFVQEDLFVAFSDVIEEANDNSPSSVVPIPGIRGSKGAGLGAIRSSVEKAVGMDIFAVQ
jgi:V/A-type H+-transporting ATPase subunit F